MKGHPEVVRVLADHGANINVDSKYGTPVSMGNVMCLSHDLSSERTKKHTHHQLYSVSLPALLLPSAAKKGHKEVLEVLKEFGAEGAAEALGKLSPAPPTGSSI